MVNYLPEEAPVAICFLGAENDNKNQCRLSTHYFTVIRKGKVTSFELDEVCQLSTGTRKMMLPLILGGIFASLSVVAMAKDLFNPWGILIWFMLNLMFFYFGWLGYPVLSVELKGFHQDFQIKAKGKNIAEFIDFVNEVLLKRSRKIPVTNTIYHILDAPQWKEIENEAYYSPESLKKEGFIHFSTKKQLPVVKEKYFKDKPDLILLHVDALKLTAELKYELVYEQESLYPHLYGPLNLEAVIKAEAIKQ